MKKLLVLVVILLLFPALAFSGGAGEGGKGKEIEIRHMTPHTAGSAFYDLYNARLDSFMEETPGIKVVHDSLPSKELRTKITVEMAAGNPAHSGWIILSYAREFMKDDKLIDWGPIYDKDPDWGKWFSQTVLDTPKYVDGRIMMAPYEAHIDGLFYNKEIFTKNGWTPPKTFDEFLALGPKARAQGITATITGGKNIRFAWLASILLARTGGLKNANALALGDAKDQWSNPKYGFPQAMAKFNDMVQTGLYPDGVLGQDDNEANQVFVNGGAATYYEGQWRPGQWKHLGGEEFHAKVGRMDFPAMPDMPMGEPKTRTGGILVGQYVSAQYPEEEREAAIKWCKFVSHPDFMVSILESETNMYAGKASWNEAAASDIWRAVVNAFRTAPRYIPSMDAYAAPPIDLAIKKTAMPGMLTGEFTVEQALAEVQKAADQYVKTLK